MDQPIKVLVTGAGGQLGQALQKTAPDYPGISFSFYTSSEADITKPEELDNIFTTIKPQYCINAAAYTAVDKAESEPEKAWLINADGAASLASACKKHDTVLLHVSTDFVFDGSKSAPYTEEDLANPQSVYGETKLAGEKAVSEVLDKYYIIRTSWVYSEFGHNFYKTMLRVAAAGNPLKVVSDQIGTPTNANDLAHALVHIVVNDCAKYGVYHYSNEGECSWYEFAREIFNINKVHADLTPIPTTDYPTPAKRPVYSVMDKSKIKRVFGLTISAWGVGLKSFKQG